MTCNVRGVAARESTENYRLPSTLYSFFLCPAATLLLFTNQTHCCSEKKSKQQTQLEAS